MLKYLDHIKTLGVEHVQAYASKLATNIAKTYNDQLSPMILNNPSVWANMPWKTIIAGVITVAGVIGGIYYFWVKSKLKEQGTMTRDLAQNNVEICQIVGETNRLSQTDTQAIRELATGVNEHVLPTLEILTRNVKTLLQTEQELKQAGFTPEHFKRTQLAIRHIEQSLTDLSVTEPTVDNFKGTIIRMNTSLLDLNETLTDSILQNSQRYKEFTTLKEGFASMHNSLDTLAKTVGEFESKSTQLEILRLNTTNQDIRDKTAAVLRVVSYLKQ
jgi:hypothetical protein